MANRDDIIELANENQLLKDALDLACDKKEGCPGEEFGCCDADKYKACMECWKEYYINKVKND